jgi:hypothetical protein
MIANFSDEELTLHKETILGVAQEISENLVVLVSDEENTDRGTEQTFYSGSNKEVPKGFKKYRVRQKNLTVFKIRYIGNRVGWGNATKVSG